jgi:hypothetical protein
MNRRKKGKNRVRNAVVGRGYFSQEATLAFGCAILNLHPIILGVLRIQPGNLRKGATVLATVTEF